MSELAITEPLSATTEPQRGKRQRISHRMRRAIDALVTGEAKTQKQAAEIAQLNNEHLCRELKKPQIEAYYAQRVRQSIARAQMRAGARLNALIDAESEHVSLDATKHVLAINGIAPPERSGVNVNIMNNVQPGYLIDLRSAPPDMSHIPAIEAKPLKDKDDVTDG